HFTMPFLNKTPRATPYVTKSKHNATGIKYRLFGNRLTLTVGIDWGAVMKNYVTHHKVVCVFHIYTIYITLLLNNPACSSVRKIWLCLSQIPESLFVFVRRHSAEL